MMSTQAPTKLPNLASIVHESEQAAQEAAAAQAKAHAAQHRAQEAQRRADEERELANQRYLDLLVTEYESARTVAVTALGEARQALEDAVRGGGDIFSAYSAWVAAGVAVWGADAALSQQRHYLGRPTREATPPAFSFSHDVSAILDQHSLELQEEALARVQERRVQFLNGKTQ